MAERIQRKRTKGWRMPEGAVYVGRPSKWGNPYGESRDVDRAQMLKQYRYWALNKKLRGELRPEDLRGKNLACWCPLDQPCHADVLLELANA